MKGVYQVEERRGVLFLYWEQHYIIDCNEISMEYPVVCLHGCCRYIFGSQACDEFFHCEEISFLAGFYSIIYQACRYVSLSCSGWSHQNNVIGLLQPGKLSQLIQFALRYSGDKVEVIFVKVVFWRYS